MLFISSAKKNIRRTPYQALAALMIMFLTFLALSSFLLIATGSEKILTFYEKKPQVIAFFKEGTTLNDVKAIQNSLNQTGKITKFKYVSKEDALQIYRDRNKSDPMLLELVTASILPASLEISTDNPANLKPIAEIVEKEPVVEEVAFPKDVVAYLTQATQLIRVVGGALVIFLIGFSILITVLIIGFKIRLKRDEIETVKLLGASNWFIRMPFMAEGILYATFGAFLGWLGSCLILWYFEPLLSNNLGEVATSIFPISIITMLLFLLSNLLVATIIGAMGSFIAVRRYLHI